MAWKYKWFYVLVSGGLVLACAGDEDSGPMNGMDVEESTDLGVGGQDIQNVEDGVIQDDTEITLDISGDIAAEIPDGAEEVDGEEPPPYIPENIVINEVVVKAVDNGPDWIEIKNMEGITVDLSGWGIRDHLNAHEYLFPEGTTVAAFGYKVVWGKGANFEFTMDFTFGSDKEARLFAPDGTQVDGTDWVDGDAPEGTSWGRFPDGVGPFMTLDAITQGQPNQAPTE